MWGVEYELNIVDDFQSEVRDGLVELLVVGPNIWLVKQASSSKRKPTLQVKVVVCKWPSQCMSENHYNVALDGCLETNA